MMQNMLLSVVLILSISAATVLASEESSQACFTAAEALNDIPSVNKAHADLIESYNSTCQAAKLCYGTIEDDLQKTLSNAAGNPADLFYTANNEPLTLTGTADFGGEFVKDKMYAVYKTACTDAGGTLGCIDGAIDLEGEIGGVLAEADGESGGNKMDIEFYIEQFPLCMPKECDGEDLKEVMVDATRDAVLASPDVQGALTPATENLLKTVTFESLCALGGPPTCSLKVDRVICGAKGLYEDSISSASSSKLGTVIIMLVASASLWAL